MMRASDPLDQQIEAFARYLRDERRSSARTVETYIRDLRSFRDYVRDNVRWLRGEGLGRCDAGRHGIAIDAEWVRPKIEGAEVHLPIAARVLVEPGQRVTAGLDVIGKLPSS